MGGPEIIQEASEVRSDATVECSTEVRAKPMVRAKYNSLSYSES